MNLTMMGNNGTSYHDKQLATAESTISCSTEEEGGGDHIVSESDILVRSDELPMMIIAEDDNYESDMGFLSEIDHAVPSQAGGGWQPSGNWWKDMLYFCGPGWLVSIGRLCLCKTIDQTSLLSLFLIRYHLFQPILTRATIKRIFKQVRRHNTT
jgi:hypothetical protein